MENIKTKNKNNKITVIFDMDGLMVNTESLYFQANIEMAKKRGKKFDKRLSKNMMGRKSRDSISAFKKGLKLKESVASLEKEREIIYKKLIQKKLSPMPGLFNLLNLLKKIIILSPYLLHHIENG